MTQDILSDRDLDVIFREARSFKGWQNAPVSEITIRAMYDLLRWGPTSFNCSPGRFVIVQSAEAKKKLAECVMNSNKDKVLLAPFTVIVGTDEAFYEKLPDLFKGYAGAKDMFVANADLAHETAFRNSSMQGGYMIIAARSLGLDCCPMSGFDPDAVNDAFFKDSEHKVNFICSMGYGDAASLPEQDRRMSFDEACEIV
ncbi:MAG: malonic semialdehyde reductase [Alphaproteobacteria bacterium]|nr:MAG: malonic semialdehyde reductase [Alphaproteobacteria bacterium]